MARKALGSLCAVKVVWRRDFEDDRPYEREFQGIRSYEPVSRKHEGLVDVYHVGRNHEEGYFYYVMELADDAAGPLDSIAEYRPLTLREELRTRGRLPVARALEIGATLASALDQLHRAGLVHRDIKPANIIFVGGVPKLADIGLVAGISDARSFVGTEGFVPPEGPGSPAADLFSLGKVLYEISTGQDRNEFPRLPPMSGAPGFSEGEFAEFNEILLKACDPSARSRYQSAGELFGDLVFLQGGKSLRRMRGLERRTALLARTGVAAALAAVVASAAYFGSFKQFQRASRAERQAQAHVEFLEMQQAEDMFRRDDFAGALAHLAHRIRANPTNRVATERLLSALTWRNHWLPSRAPDVPAGRHNVLATHPDGGMVAAGSAGGTVQLWDMATGGVLGEFQATDADVLALDWSADHTLLAIGTATGALIHDLVTEQQITLPLPPGTRVDLIRLSPDQRWVVTGGDDHGVRIWDARTGQPTNGILSRGSRVRRMVFSSDRQRIATAGANDGAARIWNVATAEPASPILRHGTRVNEIVFSPDRQWLATASEDGTARLWRVVDGKEMAKFGHRASVNDVAFSLDGASLATASADGTAVLWDWRTGSAIGSPMAHRGGVRQVRFSPDGMRLATVSEDSTVRLWDAKTAAAIGEPMRHPQLVTSVAFSTDGERLSTAVSASGVSGVWNWRTAARNARAVEYSGGGDRRAVRWLSRIGSLCVVTNRVMQIWGGDVSQSAPESVDFGVPVDLFNVSDDEEQAAVVHGNKAWVWNLRVKQAVRGPLALPTPITTVQFSPDGHYLAVGTKGGECMIWGIHPAAAFDDRSCLPQARAVPGSPEDEVFSVRFSPDGQQLVVACRDGHARVFDVLSGALRRDVRHEGAVTSAEFSPDGRWIVTASSDRLAQVWDLATGRAVGQAMRHDHEVFLARFSPDGRQVATAARDWTARVWDAASGLPVSERLAHEGPVQTLCFSPDGVRLATGSADGRARIWDTGTGLPLTDPFPCAGPVETVAFSADGSRLLIGPAVGGIRLVEVLQPAVRAPGWLPELAEAVVRCRLNGRKSMETVPAERLFALKREIDAMAENSPVVRWAKWYLADPGLRSVSPASAIDTQGYVAGLLRTGSTAALKEAIGLAPTNALAHAALARSMLMPGQTLTHRQLAEANWHQQHARQLDPANPEIERICRKVELLIRSLKGTSSR